MTDVLLDGRARELRELFDRSFALPAAGPPVAQVELLSIRVAGSAYLLRLSELGGLLADRSLLSLPSPVPAFRGVVGVRGGLVAVYSLRALLGLPAGDDGRWVAIARGVEVGFAFERYDGQLRVAPEEVVTARGLDPAQRERVAVGEWVREVVQTAEGTRPVISLAAVIQGVQARARPRSAPGVTR